MSRNKKLTPYNAKGKRGKFEAEVKKDRKYATKKAREEAKTANRSLKKSARQQGKKQVEEGLFNMPIIEQG
jgi:hypothetical protein